MASDSSTPESVSEQQSPTVTSANNNESNIKDDSPDVTPNEASSPNMKKSSTFESSFGKTSINTINGIAVIPLWVPDDHAEACQLCNIDFSLFRRRHHCRNCGGVYCHECTNNRSMIVPLGYLEPVRVCDVCIDNVSTLNESSDSDVSLYSSLEIAYKQQLLQIKSPRPKLTTSLSFTNSIGFVGTTEDTHQTPSGTDETFPDDVPEHHGNILSTDYSLFNEDESIKEWLLLLGNNKYHFMANYDKFQKKLFLGVPHRLRATVWPQLCESVDLMEKNKGVYKQLLSSPERFTCAAQVKADASRTYPEHPLFKDTNGPGQQALNNVLNCYSVFCPEVGYSQGMNFLVAIILMYLDEEASFWMFVQLMKKYSFEGVYLDGTPRLAQAVYKFKEHFRHMLPRLYTYLLKQHVVIEIFVTQWLRTLYSYNFPLDLVFRIWDVFLIEGIDFLIWIALVILDKEKDRLLSMDEMAILKFFNRLPTSSFTAVLDHLKTQSQAQ